ncbi:MAG: lipopolysaccharide heptosyltransferase I [Desulfuromonadales bacterium]|nr:lipopolysaccharide heptosyltransferase I [Desulfuromonadales bacterium]
MKVLVVKVSALGDIVHALPVLPYLHSAVFDLRVDWLVEESFASLLEGHPLIRRLHRVNTRGWRRAGTRSLLSGAWQTVRALQREKYDLVLDLQGNSKSALFTRLAGGQRYGFDRDGVREWPNLLATNHQVRLTGADHHISDRSLAIARAAVAGGEAPLAGPLTVLPAAAAHIEQTLAAFGLSGERLVVLHYGTTWPTKLWPLQSWQTLAARLVDELALRPLLTWGNDEERRAAEAIGEACGGAALLWPRGSLPELTALLARADLVVGADTGPVHMAAAVDTPTVSLYRVTDAARNGPRGARHVRLQAPMECSPCLRKSCERDAECGRSIAVETVFQACAGQLAGEGR